jgi:hypothetical protein
MRYSINNFLEKKETMGVLEMAKVIMGSIKLFYKKKVYLTIVKMLTLIIRAY